MYPRVSLVLVFSAVLLGACAPTMPAPPAAKPSMSPMSFFVTSANPGQGADRAGWPVQTPTAKSWAAQQAPVTRPGAPT